VPAFAVMAMFVAGPAFAFDASLATQVDEIPVAESSYSFAPQGPVMPSAPQATLSPLDMPAMPDNPRLGEDTTASDAFTMARNLYRRGEKNEAMSVLQFAAGRGHI